MQKVLSMDPRWFHGRAVARLSSVVVVTVVAVMTLTTATAGTGVPPVAGPPPLSPVAIEAHIAFLASDDLEGREAGMPGSRRAEEYVAKAFRAAGLDGVEEQSFEFVAGAILGEGSRLVIGGDPVAADHFVPLAFSAAGSGAADAVFAGYGISADDLEHDDYAGLSVEGRVVVVLAGSPDGDSPHGKFGNHSTTRAKALAAHQRKAAGLVVLVSADGEGVEHLPTFRGTDVSRDVGLPVLAVRESSVAESVGLDVAAVRGKLDASGFASKELDLKIEYDVRVRLERRTTSNILGWLRAKSSEVVDEVIVVGAHHDHLGRGGPASRARDRHGAIHNGADDNASGVAGVIELARFLSPRAGILRRHVLFMTFAAEERGLLGSKHFKDHPLLRLPAELLGQEVPLEGVAMLNLDMVGRLRDNKILANGLATSPGWNDLLQAVRERNGHDLIVQGDRAEDLFGSSDHISFYELGMPVVFFFTGNHSEYHMPEDDLYRVLDDGTRERLIDVDGMKRLLLYIAEVTQELAQRHENLPYKEGVELTPRMNFRVVLRLMPDYGADVEGMRVAGVSAGGPAEQGGMQEGDVIVRFGSVPVRSVRDYMVGLQQARAGEIVEIEVERDGKRQVLKIAPAASKR